MEQPETNQPLVQEMGGTRDTTGSHRRITLINLSLVNMFVGINYAILSPFLPLEASKKGVSTTLVGFIFGEFELIIFITAPLIGIVMPRIGAKFMYVSGLFVTGSCCILFGLLAYCPSGAPFLVMVLLVRGVMAFVSSMQVTASFAIIATSFPENVTAMFGLLETFTGIGLMIGPPIGGALYQVGGFVTPFAVIGGLILLTVPVSFLTLKFDSSTQSSQTGSLAKVITNPHILFAVIILWGVSASIGFMDPIQQLFLSSQFHLNQLMIGLVFLCSPAVYSILSPFVGHICDKKPVAKQLMPLSMLLIGVALLLFNPSPVLPLGPPKLWLTIVASLILGLGSSFAMAPATKDVVTECFIMGYQDNFGTFSLVSGFINSCLSLGYFSGPIISGFLTEKYGYAWSTTYMGFLMLGVAIVDCFYVIIFMYGCGGRHRIVPQEEALEPDERQPLLVST